MADLEQSVFTWAKGITATVMMFFFGMFNYRINRVEQMAHDDVENVRNNARVDIANLRETVVKQNESAMEYRVKMAENMATKDDIKAMAKSIADLNQTLIQSGLLKIATDMHNK